MSDNPLKDFEEDNDTSWYTSAAAGIASGIIKVPEGIFSLAAELMDLGLDTNKAAEVERIFDKLNPFEEIAEKNAVGKLTEALVSIGVPGGYGFKLGQKAFQAKRAGKFFSAKSKNLKKSRDTTEVLNKKAGYKKFAAGVAGGAAGETFVADVEGIGSFGDIFEDSLTSLDRDESLEGREDATRKLLNRLKFGAESVLITPAVYGVGSGAKRLAKKGAALQFSKNKFDRILYSIANKFTPQGGLDEKAFATLKDKEGLMAQDLGRAKQLLGNITRSTEKMFPNTQGFLDTTYKKDQGIFYEKINDLIFSGKSNQGKELDSLTNAMKKKKIGGKEQRGLINSIKETKKYFNNLIKIASDNTLGESGVETTKEIKNLLQDRLKNQLSNTYSIFEPKGITKYFRKNPVTNELMDKATDFFREEISLRSKVPLNKVPTQEARQVVERIVNQVRKQEPNELPNFTYHSKTLGGKIVRKSYAKMGKEEKQLFDELFGKVKDPRYSIFNAATTLSSIARNRVYVRELLNQNNILKNTKNADGELQKGFLWKTKEAAEEAVGSEFNNIKIVEIDDQVISKIPGLTAVKSPLGNMRYGTQDMANSLKNLEDIQDGLVGLIRGKDKDGKELAGGAKFASLLYRNMILVPKGVSQLGKTVLSIPTHIRNFMSAAAFTAANGLLFQNPKNLAKDFKRGIKESGIFNVETDNFLFKTKTSEVEKAYQELQSFGIVNQQVQLGDFKALVKDTQQGITDLDTVLSPMLKKFKGFNQFFQGKYVAEDDVFKITNFYGEIARRRTAYQKANIKRTQKQLKEEAAEIVRNTVPNYGYVGSFVKSARVAPFGNFMSFPSEIIRTTSNIAELGIKEMRHSKPTKGSNLLPFVTEMSGKRVANDNPMHGIGLKRLMGMALTTTAVPILTVEGAKALYDITEDELIALKRFVPEYSKNSTIIPIKEEDGTLRYMDFSHSNAYDLVSRPFRTLVNNVHDELQNSDTVLRGFTNGIIEASAEVMNPFVSESIFTEALLDLTTRKGRTSEGRQLYTEQTPEGDKAAIRFMHLGKALAPSYKAYERIIRASLDIPSVRGQKRDLGPELLGLMGFRPIKVEPLESMDFKITDFKNGVRNSRREFTGGQFGVLKGGRISSDEIIERYVAANRAQFNVEKEIFKDIQAAEELGVDSNQLGTLFKDRQISASKFFNLQQGRFDPFYPSDRVIAEFQKNADEIGQENPFPDAQPILNELRQEFLNLDLFGGFDVDLNSYFGDEVQAQPLPPTPEVNPQVVSTPMPAPGTVAQSGLTPTEQALLSPEEQQIRLRQRGTIT